MRAGKPTEGAVVEERVERGGGGESHTSRTSKPNKEPLHVVVGMLACGIGGGHQGANY
jgi:hypothetical protein